MRILFWGLMDIWNVIKDMAWQISIVILLVLLCRLFIGKISKQASYLLWAVVAIRLLIPVMPASDFSIFNAVDKELFQEMPAITEEIADSDTSVQENSSVILQNQNENINVTVEDTAIEIGKQKIEINTNIVDIPNNNESNSNLLSNTSTSQIKILKENWAFVAWIVGMFMLNGYGVISYCMLKHKLRFATTSDKKIYEDEHITSPFVFGFVKPRIYLPYHLSEDEREYILRHENYHIKRRDYLVKILAFGLLAVYWFHPLVWVAYYLMSRDMELSCDEQVLKELGVEERKAYSTLLLSFACEKRIPLPSPVSFGENDIKSRIKSIQNYKKPTFWSLVAVVVLAVVLTISCLTDANENLTETENTDADENYELTEETTQKLAKTLFQLKNQYIGDAAANGYVFNELFAELGITGCNGMELQTTTEPYWISLHFDSKPGVNKMWQASAMFLALVENASEVRWSYYDESYNLCTYYVTVDSVNKYFEGESIKDYASSEEKIAELWEKLDQKRTFATTASESETSILVSSTDWDGCAIEAGLEFTERIAWENRLIADGIGYRGDDGIVKDCIYQDFDQNGITDLLVIIRDKNWDDEIDDRFCIYMNNNDVYIRELSFMGAYWIVTIVDIDNDGYLEFLFSGDSGGTGGYGFNAIYDLLKYKDNTFEVMPLPLDEYVEYEDETAGFGVEVYTAKGEGNYTAFCPALKESVSFSIESSRSDVFEADTPENTLVGRECYGFHELTPVLQNGKMYLLAKESIYRTNIYQRMEDIGTAYFLLSWDANKGWVTEKFNVIPYGYDGISDEAMFARMLQELAFYPSTYADIMATSTLPVVNENNYIVKDNPNLLSLSNFASIESGEENGYIGSKMIYVKLNENNEPTYHYIYHNSDGRYFYMEAERIIKNASERFIVVKKDIFADCIYETVNGSNDTQKTEYYLTGEDREVPFLAVSKPNALDAIVEILDENWDTMPYRNVINNWQITSLESLILTARYDDKTKSVIYKVGEEAYTCDLTEELADSNTWNWQVAGIFEHDASERTYICLSDFNITYEEGTSQNPETILIEFPSDNPNDYQVTSYDEGLAWIDSCYFIGDTIYIRSEDSLLALNVLTKELRFCEEEHALLEAYAKEKFNAGAYQICFFDAIRVNNDTIVYSAAVSESEDVTPVGMVFIVCKNGEPLGYMYADYSSSDAANGVTIEMAN